MLTRGKPVLLVVFEEQRKTVENENEHEHESMRLKGLSEADQISRLHEADAATWAPLPPRCFGPGDQSRGSARRQGDAGQAEHCDSH
jgi:hypothetical protein